MTTGNHHDTFFKSLLQLDRYTIQLLEQLLPQELLPLLDLERIERVAGSFISSGQRESRSDALIKIPLRQGGDLQLYFLIEHKSRPDPDIHRQLLDYLHSIYRQQTIPVPVIPIVFYHGQPKWKIPLSFTEQFMKRFMKRLRTPEARIEERTIELLSGYLPNFSCHLYDLSRQRYEQVGLAPGLEVSLLAMQRYWDLENMEFLRKLESGLKRLLKEDRKLFENIVAYLARGGRMRLEPLKRHISSMEVFENMNMVELLAEERRMEGIAEGMAEGIAEGIEKGRVEGKAEGIVEGMEKGIERGRLEGMEKAVRALYSHRMSREEIARNLNLPLDQVERYLSRQP